MSNETKRDVFEELLEIAGYAMDQAMSAQYPSDENGCAPSGIDKAICDILDPIEERYDAALPDNLPVIPKYVADYIVYWKEQNNSLIDIALESAHTRMDSDDSSEAFDWVHNHFEKFSRAWVLGIWRVEETGEIVKAEEEK